jgi:hypothetical protein
MTRSDARIEPGSGAIAGVEFRPVGGRLARTFTPTSRNSR